MQFLRDFALKLGGLAVSAFVRRLGATLDTRVNYYDPAHDPAHPDFRGPVILLFWHEYIMLPFYMRGNCGISMLLSRHRDAEWLSRAAMHMGYDTIRGSTYRGAGTALRQLMGRGKTSNLAITPDGPRGPRRRLAQGSVYLSSKLQIPLLPMGVGYDRPWRLPTWDHFAVPRPYSRGAIVVGPKVQIPDALDRAGVERYRLQMEQLLERLTFEAEAWAENGKRAIGQRPLCRQAKPLWSCSPHHPGPAEAFSNASALPVNPTVGDAPADATGRAALLDQGRPAA